MKNTQTPTGEAQNGQKKEWYKKWWGILIALAIWPLFAIWYITEKKKDVWSKEKQGFAIIGVIVLAFFVYSGDSSKETPKQQAPATQTQEAKTTNTNEQAQPAVAQTQPQPETTQAPQNTAPQFSFDVPSLIGKNIDEVKAILGKPTDYTAPTKQQLALSSIWDMGYTKDDVNLLITYSPKNKIITDFFIDGSDKNKLLTQGNLQENNDNYKVEFVKNVMKPDEITGVKIMKKLPSELAANVTYNALAFKIENKEDYDWTDCKFELNGGGKVFSGGYEFKSASGIKAKDSAIIPFSEFTKDSKRFDFTSERPENLFIACNSIGQHRTNYFAIN